MSKKTNTLWFVLGATVFNIITTMIIFILLFFVVYAQFLMPSLPEESVTPALFISFFGAIVLSFFLYRFILKQIMKKADMEKHFDPIFGHRRRR